jgi:hypothetical protein
LSTTEHAAVGAVVDEMYAMISGPKGPRDWSRQANAFTTDARQMRTGVDADGRAWIKTMGPTDYAKDVTAFFEANDFFEVEIARRIDVLGNMAQVWSLYEARTAPDDATPERRGVNSIQLYRDPNLGWRIVSMIWDNERPGVSVAPF